MYNNMAVCTTQIIFSCVSSLEMSTDAGWKVDWTEWILQTLDVCARFYCSLLVYQIKRQIRQIKSSQARPYYLGTINFGTKVQIYSTGQSRHHCVAVVTTEIIFVVGEESLFEVTWSQTSKKETKWLQHSSAVLFFVNTQRIFMVVINQRQLKVNLKCCDPEIKG